MSRICEITGKGTAVGNNVSHSQRKTRRTFMINLQKRTLVNPATGTKMSVRLSTTALRTLKKWQREGKQYDLRELVKN
ncbi:MAG: 50S ribosomal protein L28 [Parcubacteria group bacterium]